jgi:hypothetical protein
MPGEEREREREGDKETKEPATIAIALPSFSFLHFAEASLHTLSSKISPFRSLLLFLCKF